MDGGVVAADRTGGGVFRTIEVPISETITNPDGSTSRIRHGPELCRMCHLKQDRQRSSKRCHPSGACIPTTPVPLLVMLPAKRDYRREMGAVYPGIVQPGTRCSLTWVIEKLVEITKERDKPYRGR